MANELSDVEKILVSTHGFTDNGDGTVSSPKGALFDTEQGGYYTATGAAPVDRSSSSSTNLETTSSNSSAESSGPGNKYLKTEGFLTYGKENLNNPNMDQATKDYIKNSDKYTVYEDGTFSFTDDDGTEQFVPVGTDDATVNTSNIDLALVQKAADLTYLAQNTGVKTSDLDEVYRQLGLNPADTTVSVQKNAILKAFGYNPGSNENFYGTNSAIDQGAKILFDRWQQVPSDEELEAAGLDPATYTIINSNVANQAYLRKKMQEMGGINTSAHFANLDEGQTAESSRAFLDKIIAEGNPEGYWAKKQQQTGMTASDLQLDMLEWDLIKKKAAEKQSAQTSQTGATGITSSGTSGTGGAGGVSGGYTISEDTLTIPDSAVIPTLKTSQVAPTDSETYTTPAQTFEQNLTDQATNFQDRAIENQQYMQPQTMAEKQAAGQDVSSYAISQKLYRNPQTGHQLFITFQGGRALSPIPQGYFEVSQQTGTFGQQNVFNPITAGGNTYTTGANKGAYIQGFSGEDGSLVDETSNTGNAGSPIDPNQLYGNVTFQDPVTGQLITQTPEEYFQSLANKQAQAIFNPASSVTMPGVATMAELGYQYDADGNIMMDPETGQPMYQELMPGTVIDSTAGQASGMAPVVGKYQARDAQGNLMFDAEGNPVMVGADPAQVSDVVQAKGPGTPAQYDEQGNLISAAVGVPGAAQAALTTASSGVAKQLEGGTTTNYAAMAAAVPGSTWDNTTGTFKVGEQTFTPDQFIAANNLNVGDYLTTTGGLQAAQMSGGPTKTIDAAQMQKQKIDPTTGQPMFTIDAEGKRVPVMETATSVSGMEAAAGTSTEVGVRQKADPETGELMYDAQGNPIMERVLPKRTLQEQVVDPVTGEVIQTGELITGTGVDQAKVGTAFGTGEVTAASVQDELTTLMQQFEGGETPPWAAGAMRKATATMAARGLGASSMAGQAIIQAAMEAALPIAQIDAGNKQQMALFKAEQRAKFLGMEFDQAFQAKVMNAARVSEIANMNFSADQQVALENSRAANTMNLQNLSNKQALVMAEAAALSQMDMANLSNLQQAQVQNAQNFLQIDMANLNNSQQTALFKAQQVTNAMLSDTAQANATAQFNATSENQTNQFFSNLSAQVSQFNAAQQNAINQFNAEETNALLEFNAALQNQREMFNAQNYLVVAQANAQWRQNINTANTEAQNVANLTYAKEVNGLTQKALDDYWQKERDIMSYAFAQSEGAADRGLKILLGEQSLTSIREQLEFKENEAKSEFWSDLLFGDASFSDLFSL